MNALLPRILKSAYRREPIVSFVITVGAVDTVIGGVTASLPLLSLGLGTVGVAVAWRWWLIQRSPVEQQTETAPEYYLPPSSSRPSLPMLTQNKKSRPPY
ncbi:MAG: hypothetical protein EA414_05655 [Arthrospira sp. PLM2.Bin9]|nr:MULTISPECIES: hypothetical protein [unclassified Arthrospira]MBS0015328.1 hypothetical protein [Arthrospira sp. SH-MAG29]TVU54629.1 MAG: hypothetical protein EA414_05655 [Arthrospira sp. PLM2.Bin9]